MKTAKMSGNLNTQGPLSRKMIRRGLIKAGVAGSQIEIDEVGCLGYATDVGPISLVPRAVIGVRCHEDVERAARFASDNDIPITARGAGSGLPGQSVGSGIVLDTRGMVGMEVLGDHPEGGKIVFAQAGVICTRLNTYLKDLGVFLPSYPASTDMATIGGMIANNASGANSCKLGTTQHHVLDLHVVLADGTGLWTSEIRSDREPWSRIIELIRGRKKAIERDFPRVPKNSSGYNVLDIWRQLERGAAVDWTRLFAHSEGTLGIITEAKLRALPLARQKATCIVYFTSLQAGCGAIPKIYALGPSCFDTAVTTNLELIRKRFPGLGIREDAKLMYLIEFDDLEVKPDPKDPARRIGRVGLMDGQRAADVIQGQVRALKDLLEKEYPDTAVGFDVATDPAKQDALWVGRRAALQVLYSYDPAKRPLTMIECVVLPRDEKVILGFIKYMEEVLEEEQVVAGTHGHAGDCNFHIYLLLNLSQEEDRRRLVNVMTKITKKVIEAGGSMSGEHADGRTRGAILPHVFGLDLFDLFVAIKDVMDPKATLHPGTKIVREARDKDLGQAIQELVGRDEKDSRLNLGRFRDLGHLFSGPCSICSQCADSCPVFRSLPDEYPARSEAAPTFKRALAIALDGDGDLAKLRDDPKLRKIFDLCLLCGSCTVKCPTDATMRDMVIRMRERTPSRVLAPALQRVSATPWIRRTMIRSMGTTQGLWQNRMSRRLISWLPQGLLPTRLPYNRVLPRLAKVAMERRYPENVNLPPSEANIAYFFGCSSQVFAEPVAESFMNIARHNNWRVSFPPQQCCGEPFACAGNTGEYLKLAKANIDRLHGYEYIIAHCPSCIVALREYAHDFERKGATEEAAKAREIAKKLYDPARFVAEVVGIDHLKPLVHQSGRKVAVHVSCHEKLGHKMGATKNGTRDLLSLVPGMEMVPMRGAEECCGAGGMWGLTGHYELSRRIRRDKIDNIVASGADEVTTWCSLCLVHLRDGLGQALSKIEVVHPLELISRGYGPHDRSV